MVDSLMVVDESVELLDKINEHMWAAGVHRQKGELHWLNADGSAESCLVEALSIARDQGFKSLELRASESLARLWADQGKRRKALDLLAPSYNWFTEGQDTADLEEAKALLDELR